MMSSAANDQLNAMQSSLVQVISFATYTGDTGSVLTALILSYSTIDTLSWLAAKGDEEHVDSRFVRWVDRFMLPAAPGLNCTAEELYAARCGVIHTMTSDSRLHQRNPLRRIVYAWGKAQSAALQSRIDRSPWRGKIVTVHLRDLTDGVRLGAAQFFEDALTDARLTKRIKDKEGKFFGAFTAQDLGISAGDS